MTHKQVGTHVWGSLVCVLLRDRREVNVGNSYRVLLFSILNISIRLCFRRKVAHVSPHCPICNILVGSYSIRLGFRGKACCSGSLRQAGVL